MLLLGNIAALIGCIIMVGIGLIKKKEHILTAQCVQFFFMGLGNFFLGATAGVISNCVSILRNLVFAKLPATTSLKLLFIAVQTWLTVMTAGSAWIEWLPVIAVIGFTWFVDLKNPVAFKIMLMATLSLWVVYDFYYRNYVGFAFDMMTMISTTIGIFRIKKANAEG